MPKLSKLFFLSLVALCQIAISDSLQGQIKIPKVSRPKLPSFSKPKLPNTKPGNWIPKPPKLRKPKLADAINRRATDLRKQTQKPWVDHIRDPWVKDVKDKQDKATGWVRDRTVVPFNRGARNAQRTKDLKVAKRVPQVLSPSNSPATGRIYSEGVGARISNGGLSYHFQTTHQPVIFGTLMHPLYYKWNAKCRAEAWFKVSRGSARLVVRDSSGGLLATTGWFGPGKYDRVRLDFTPIRRNNVSLLSNAYGHRSQYAVCLQLESSSIANIRTIIYRLK